MLPRCGDILTSGPLKIESRFQEAFPPEEPSALIPSRGILPKIPKSFNIQDRISRERSVWLCCSLEFLEVAFPYSTWLGSPEYHFSISRISKVCAKTIDTLCKIPRFLSQTWTDCYELTRGDSDNYKDIFQSVSIRITKIYTQKKYRRKFADCWKTDVHTKKFIPACSPFLAKSKYVTCDLIWLNGEPF